MIDEMYKFQEKVNMKMKRYRDQKISEGCENNLVYCS
jgi:hypothetical protein